MDIRGKRLIVVGGAGLIGSHIVDELTREDVGEIVVYDNVARGTAENLQGALKDPRMGPSRGLRRQAHAEARGTCLRRRSGA